MRPEFIDNLRPGFREALLGLEIWQWLGLICLIFAGIIGALVLRLATMVALKVRERVAGHPMAEDVRKGFLTAASVVGASATPLQLVRYLELPDFIEEVLSKGLLLALIWGFVAGLFAFWDAVSNRIAHHAVRDAMASKTLVPVTRKFVRALIVVIGLCVMLAYVFSVNVTAMVASLGIGGLVVALAAKDSVENIFGSLTIMFDMPFGIGDWVRVGEIDGTVEEINLRSTRIRTFEDSIITLPNSNLIKVAVENFGRRRYRRLRTTIPLEASAGAEKIGEFCERVRDYLRAHPKIRQDAIRAELFDFTDKSANVLLYLYMDVADYNEELRTRSDLLVHVIGIADELGLQISSSMLAVVQENAP